MAKVKIRAFTEWSWIFAEYIPMSYFETLNGNDVEVETFPCTEHFFYFVDKLTCKEMSPPDIGSQNLYDHELPECFKENWMPPPYKNYYSKISKLKPSKPVLLISNKYNDEWNLGPKNYLSVEFLDKIFNSKLNNVFEIYYIRYEGDSFDKSNDYYDDVSAASGFGDYKLISKYKNVKTIYDVTEEYNIGFNEAQMWMHSQAKNTISVNGGNAILSSYFGESVFIYGCCDCYSTDRGVWKTDSWLKYISGCNIFGYTNYESLLNSVEEKCI
tara:strand:- start:2679 stop:3491 length:813 start_codon:yes stop_codon:yes gene_type:complete